MTVVPCSSFGAGDLVILNLLSAISLAVVSTRTRTPSRTVSRISCSAPSMNPILARPKPPLRSLGSRSDLSEPATVKNASRTISGVMPLALSVTVIVRSSPLISIFILPTSYNDLAFLLETAPFTASNAFCKSSLTETSAIAVAYMFAPRSWMRPAMSALSFPCSEPNFFSWSADLEAAEVEVVSGRATSVNDFFGTR